MPETPEQGGSDELVGRRTFSTSFRGFDQGEVRSYLELLAGEFAKLEDRIAELEGDAERASVVVAQPMDVATLTSALGEETAKVLRAAQQAAEDLRLRAEEGAERTLRDAQEEASRLRGSAESLLADRTSEAEQAAEQLRREAEEASARTRAEATAESEAVIAQAVATGRDMVGQAQAARERVLADLARRRKAALTQLEALRAGREQLLASFVAARSHLDQIVEDIDQADEEARAAAEMVGRSTAKAAARAAEQATGATEQAAGAEAAQSANASAEDARSAGSTSGEPTGERLFARSPSAEPTEEAKAGPAPAGPTSDLTPDAVAEAVVEAMAEMGPALDVATVPGAVPEVGSLTGEVGFAAETPLDAEALHGEPAAVALEGQEPDAAPGEEVADTGTGQGAPGDGADSDLLVVRDVVREDATETEGEVSVVHETDAIVVDDGTALDDHMSGPVDSEPARPPYPHDPVPAAVITGPSVGDPPPGGRVDRLFAQIRADRAGAVLEARDVLAQPEAAPAATPFAADDAGLEAPRSDADESYLQRRDLLVEVALGTTTRALKRALADDQNGTLERLRTVPGDAELSTLVEAEDVQVRAWARRATPGLIDGAAAGAKLADTGQGEAPKFDPETVGAIADRLAEELVLPLRRRLLDVLEAAAGDRSPDTMDRVNSVFREWRGRVDRAVADAVTESVSAGFVAAVDSGVVVRWVVEDADGPCPDCDDNALSGATLLGEAFPTGQIAPPAHPGCRCVLARST